MTSYSGTGSEEEWLQRARANNSVAPPLRLSPAGKLFPIQARSWFAALQPVMNTPGMSLRTVVSIGEFVYPELMLLASGIQAAGPALTSDTFAAGLMTAHFPNPDPGRAPYYQPSVGFGPGDHSFYDDYNVSWWSDAADALDIGVNQSAKGSWCYLDQGARFRAGGYPSDARDRLFNPAVPCR